MKFNLKLWPVVLTAVVSSAVLFGGWHAYKSFALERPLAELVREAEGVHGVETDLQSDAVIVRLKVDGNADVRSIVRKIYEEGTGSLGGKTVDLRVTNASPSPVLDKWWSQSLFVVAQAMETKQYGQIPEELQKRAHELPGLQVTAEMDDRYVYIRMVLGDEAKHVVLPREAGTLRAWSNA